MVTGQGVGSVAMSAGTIEAHVSGDAPRSPSLMVAAEVGVRRLPQEVIVVAVP
jgi:hypothetical protein